MKMAYNYPTISVEAIMSLRVLMRDTRTNPRLVENSPYDEITKQTLKQLFGFSKDNNIKAETKKLEDLNFETETMNLYQSIEEINDLESIDPKEKIQILKLKASLLQQLLDMMKESKKIKEINQFVELVYTILTDEQKDKLLEG
nr:MAG TPA: hypothetical protein [Caudoviricetes sp.]